MTTNYPIGDFIIRVKNAAMAKRKDLEVKKTNLILTTAEALKRAGYVDEIKKDGENLHLKITFKFKKPLLMGAKLVSKPGLRIYMGADEIEKIKGPSVFLISTPLGVLTSREAIKKRTGGEVLVEIW